MINFMTGHNITICSTTLSTMCYLIYQTECSFFRFSPSIYVNIHWYIFFSFCYYFDEYWQVCQYPIYIFTSPSGIQLIISASPIVEITSPGRRARGFINPLLQTNIVTTVLNYWSPAVCDQFRTPNLIYVLF
jgi:hypothetical protein